MRILYLHPNAWSGEPVILRTLTEMGHSICVLEERRGLAAGAREPSGYFLSAGDAIGTLWYDPGRGWEKALTWPVDRAFKRAFEGRNLAHRMWVEREAVKHFMPDVVFCSDGFSYAIPAAFLKRLGLLVPPLVVSYIGGDVLDCPEAGVGKSREGLTGWLIRKSIAVPDMLRPVSPKVRDVLIEEGADPARIRVIPSHLVADPAALEQTRLRRVRIAADLRAKYGLPADGPLIVTLGANHKGKGLHLLARAWPEVLRRWPRARWLLCGPGHPSLDEGVWPVLDATRTRSGVVAVGRLDGLAVFEHLAAADIHVNPSLCESLNMVSVEAAAVGTPTITSDGAGICDWINRLDCGAVVPHGEVEPLADAIIRALDSAALRDRWTDACRALVPEFAPRTVAAQLLDCMGAATR